jgi:hypothetical protein
LLQNFYDQNNYSIITFSMKHYWTSNPRQKGWLVRRLDRFIFNKILWVLVFGRHLNLSS